MKKKELFLKELLKNYTDLVWDYDDTLSNTIDKKGDAYARIFCNESSKLRDFVKNHHLKHPGLSRDIKLPIYIKESMKYTNNKNSYEINLAKKMFSKYCIDLLTETPLVSVLEDYIENSLTHKKHHILTNMPQDEIDKVILSKNMVDNFNIIKGSSNNKVISLREIILLLPSNANIAVIGDSEQDFIAAKKNKIDFILRESRNNLDLQEKLSCPIIKVLD